MRRRTLVRLLPAMVAAGCRRSSKPAPDFELLELSGRYMRLHDLRGRRVLLTFWTTSCGICRRELPELDRIRLEYGNQGVTVLTVCGDSRNRATDFLNNLGLDLATTVDPQFDVFQRYEVGGVPTTLLIDEQGLVKKRWLGMAIRDIREALEQASS